MTHPRDLYKWPGKRVMDDLPIMWTPGRRLPEHSMDESWGTHIDVTCSPAELKVGKTAVCSLSYTSNA